MRKTIGFAAMLAGCGVLAASLQAAALELKDLKWRCPSGVSATGATVSVASSEPVKHRFAVCKVPAAEFSGKLVRLSGEYRTDALVQAPGSLFGGRVNLKCVPAQGPAIFYAFSPPSGTCDWTSFELPARVPDDVKTIDVQLGIQAGSGKLEFRNLKLEDFGTPVSLGAAANMAWRDEVAGDGRGGWIDAGPSDDGRYLERAVRRNLLHGGFPFAVETAGRGVMVMNQPEHFPSGPLATEVKTAHPVSAKYLYLLHTACWMGKQREFGTVTVVYDSGREQRFTLANTRDLVDWSRVARLPNARPAVRAYSKTQSSVALYASRFELDPTAGKVTAVRFGLLPERPIWIVAGITLSDLDFMMVEPAYEIKTGTDWKPLARDKHNRRIAGSPLDLNQFRLDEPCGSRGRVIVTPDGHFAFEKEPERKIRFFTNTVTIGYLTDHAAIDEYVDELCKNGFNMLRLHYLDLNLVRRSKHTLEFDPKMLDGFDYLVSRCKARGIYLNLDCMTNSRGWEAGESWNKKVIAHRARIYFEPKIREEWKIGMKQLLDRVNPYTGTKLATDPVLALAVGLNEQEFGFMRDQSSAALPAWRAFLARRYGTIEALRGAWGKRAAGFKSFDDVPLYRPGMRTLEADADFAAFVYENDTAIMRFYRQELDALGYKGPLSGFNMVGNKHYMRLRRDFDFVTKNTYEMLPSRYSKPGSTLEQRSATGLFSRVFRNTLGARIAGKPFFVTEYGFPFWNCRRYELPYIFGAYASFQDFDGLAAFGDSYSHSPVEVIRPVRIYTDPVSVASEFLTFFLFMRGDVAAAPKGVIINCDESKITAVDGDRGSPSQEEGLYGLMAKVGWSIGTASKKSAASGEPVIPAVRSAASEQHRLHSSALDRRSDGAANPAGVLRRLGVIDAANRSDGINFFESGTRELFFDGGSGKVVIDTPRFQGVCGEAGTTAKLSDFTVLSMTRRGSLSLIATDGAQPVGQARQLVLAAVTNVLNSGMKFDSRGMQMLEALGGEPALLETTTFHIAIRNRNAAKLRLYPLALDGRRLGSVTPVRVDGEMVEFKVDTAVDGAAMFFEIAE